MACSRRSSPPWPAEVSGSDKTSPEAECCFKTRLTALISLGK